MSYKGTLVNVTNLNEKEEAIHIEVAMLLRPDYVSRVMIIPLLSLLTLFIFPLKLYWST
jgi:hypothetical protein